ncbi:2-methylcitrate dehydratase PrpD [Hypoxylon fragiforme]|uniref:2-methylcitrate dehydratase PrpD n=1 Tax=Hypoxylon fragiforme TaxID=63214 RepID=UPI0020C70207|nr:2-methylcitrate dehydratase PrpD [Hypoxylon fragiforme]KAI2608768.1 2-methylcitrate dehydratase PrpD [Hypoxylon fragiforme]
MATLTLATWSTNLTYLSLTPPVVDAAVKSIYNWAGCAIGGFAQAAPQIALNVSLANGFNGPSTASILGLNGSLDKNGYGYADAQLAALINGIASHVDDYDDTHLASIIHPTGVVASALLAVSESQSLLRREDPVSGPDFLTAFVAGIEAELKLGLSVYPEHYDVGWHITSTTGAIGAAVGVSKLLGLDTEHTQHAIGIASTHVIGMQVFFGSMTKSFHIGRASQSGMLAALLARDGYTSSLSALEDKYGWLHVVSTRENGTANLAELGQTWEIESNTFKPFPCGIVMHPIIDGCIQLRGQAIAGGKPISVESVQSIGLRVNPEVLVLTGQTDPQTGLEGKFSIYHATAVGLLYGEATPAQFTDEVVLNATVIAMRKLVNVTTDDSVGEDQAYVSITFGDGSTLEKYVEHAIGSLDNPLTVDDLKNKFLEQVSRQIGGSRAQKAYDAFTNIGKMTDVGKIKTLF